MYGFLHEPLFFGPAVGAVARLAEGKLWERVSIFDFIPPVHHTAILARTSTYDATADINAAILAIEGVGGGVLECLGRVNVTTVNLRPKVFLEGPVMSDVSTAPRIQGTPGFNVLVFPTGGGTSFYGLERLVITGGQHALHVPAAAAYTTYVRVKDVQMAPASACLRIESQIEEWYFDNVRLTGAQYGIYADGAGVFDKSTFKDVLINGQSLNCLRIEKALSGSVTWLNLILNTPGQHGALIDGGLRDWTFLNCNTEGIGQTGKNARTIGSITTGTNSLTVISAAGFAVGDPCTVAGAGTNGADLSTIITAIAGLVFTLAVPAATTVTSAKVTNAQYDEFVFTNALGTPSQIRFIGGLLGSEGSGGKIRYSINNAIGAGLSLYDVGVQSDRPVYDPGGWVGAFGGQTSLRRVASATLNVYRRTVLVDPVPSPVEASPNVLISPAGKSMLTVLADSNADGTGATFGHRETRKNDSNRTLIEQLRGDTLEYLTRGRIVQAGLSGVSTFVDQNTTPSIQSGNVFRTANTVATTITNFTNGLENQIIKILATDANTTVANNATIVTNTGANKLLAPNKVYTFTQIGTVWYEDA